MLTTKRELILFDLPCDCGEEVCVCPPLPDYEAQREWATGSRYEEGEYVGASYDTHGGNDTL